MSFDNLPVDDQAILAAVVRLRLLSFGQLHRLLFAGRHPTLTRRRLRRLHAAGWLILRDGPRRRRRGIRFALPARRTLAAVLPRLQARTATEPFAALIVEMLPRNTARPLAFADGTTPKWLAHQVEVNQLVTAIAASSRAVRWASAWDAPFPTGTGIALPQPDYVLVEDMQGETRIVFGEHDRGTEPAERFIARKIEPYTDLATFPEITTAWFGSAPFVVHVSVIDVPHRAPMRRLRALLDAAAQSRHPDLFRFTLGGWLHAYPDASVFFSSACTPTSDSAHWQDHATLVGTFGIRRSDSQVNCASQPVVFAQGCVACGRPLLSRAGGA